MAFSMISWRARGGSHADHVALAHETMGSVCASKAGSARPFNEASARIKAMLRDWPPPPLAGAVAAATARRWRSRVEVETPMVAWP